jgi:hypothetical protein
MASGLPNQLLKLDTSALSQFLENPLGRPACGIFELTHLGQRNKCNTLLQKMHTASARRQRDRRTNS